jgi:hypothetical protein
LYLLRDTVTGDKYPIQVLPSNKEIHVDFWEKTKSYS